MGALLKVKTGALHSSASAEWGSPPEVVEFARDLMGGIDLDPASSRHWNRTVKAKRIYTAEDNGLIRPWEGRVFCNPPGDRSGKLIQRFWRKLVRDSIHTTASFWVGFSLEQLVSLQKFARNPLAERVWLIVPRQRIHYLDDGDGDADDPTHGSYLAYIPHSRPEPNLEEHGPWPEAYMRQHELWMENPFGKAIVK